MQDKLDDLQIEQKRLALDERIARNQLLQLAAQRDPIAAASIAFGAGKGRHALPIQTGGKQLGDTVLETLVTKMLNERDDDPAMKIARLRRAALEDRALRRVMEADDDDDDDQGGGSMVREVMVAFMTAAATALAPTLASLAPAAAAKLQAATGAVPAPDAAGAPRSTARDRLSTDPSQHSVVAGPMLGGPMANISPLAKLKVRFVLRQLDQLTPEDFAAWALTQPSAESMLVDLAETPDDQLSTLLEDAIADPSTADWHEVLQWLFDHPSDTRRIMTELRRQLSSDDSTVDATVEGTPPPATYATGGW